MRLGKWLIIAAAFVALWPAAGMSDNTVVPQNQNPRYPVVLVHGMASRDTILNRSYWGRIPDNLRGAGMTVYLGNTDAWGTYETNAEILKTNIEQCLSDTGAEKVNIIAHSKGGLDSRYMIKKYDFGSKVASLTTVCTPHNGAEVADLVYGVEFINTPQAATMLAALVKIYGDSNPDMQRVLEQITTKRMEQFNREITPDERVYYQSLYTTMEKPWDDVMFSPTNLYINSVKGPNDGMVSQVSARWGNNSQKIAGSFSHLDIVDIKMRSIRGIHVPRIYLDITRDLAKKGF